MRSGPSLTLQVCCLMLRSPFPIIQPHLSPCDSFNMLSRCPPQGLRMSFPLLGMLIPEIFVDGSLFTLRSQLKCLHLREALLTAPVAQASLPTPDSVSHITPLIVSLAAASIRCYSISSRCSAGVAWDPGSFWCIASPKLCLPAASRPPRAAQAAIACLRSSIPRVSILQLLCPVAPTVSRAPLWDTCLPLHPAWPPFLHSPSSVFWNLASGKSDPRQLLSS